MRTLAWESVPQNAAIFTDVQMYRWLYGMRIATSAALAASSQWPVGGLVHNQQNPAIGTDNVINLVAEQDKWKKRI